MSNDSPTIHVIGTSGRTGIVLCRSLLADEIPVAPIVRNADKWAATGVPFAPCIADLEDPTNLHAALQDATHIVCCAHARHARAVIEAAPAAARLVFLGSTRKFTKWPDAHGD